MNRMGSTVFNLHNLFSVPDCSFGKCALDVSTLGNFVIADQSFTSKGT